MELDQSVGFTSSFNNIAIGIQRYDVFQLLYIHIDKIYSNIDKFSLINTVKLYIFV